jgi:hypothetical protein
MTLEDLLAKVGLKEKVQVFKDERSNGNGKHNTVGPIDNTIYFNILQIASGSA